MIQVIINFDDEIKARAFMMWLDNMGEQDYYGWIRIVLPRAEVDTFEYDYEQRIIDTVKDR